MCREMFLVVFVRGGVVAPVPGRSVCSVGLIAERPGTGATTPAHITQRTVEQHSQ